MAKKPAKDTAPATSGPVDSDMAIVEAAFASGNYAMVRSQAKNAASPPARELAQRLMPRIVVDPETYRVTADGVHLTCEPAKVLPLAQRYHLF